MKSMFGNPLPLAPKMPAEGMAKMSECKFLESIQAVQESIFLLLRGIYELPSAKPHNHKPGDIIWVQRHHKEALGPHWKEPNKVILTIPTAMKVGGISVG